MFDIMKNSRLYKFLRKIAGDEVSITPANVLEDCLDDIADVMGESGLTVLTAVSVSDHFELTESDAALLVAEPEKYILKVPYSATVTYYGSPIAVSNVAINFASMFGSVSSSETSVHGMAYIKTTRRVNLISGSILTNIAFSPVTTLDASITGLLDSLNLKISSGAYSGSGSYILPTNWNYPRIIRVSITNDTFVGIIVAYDNSLTLVGGTLNSKTHISLKMDSAIYTSYVAVYEA